MDIKPCDFCGENPFEHVATKRLWCTNPTCRAKNVPFWHDDWQTRPKEWKELWIKVEG